MDENEVQQSDSLFDITVSQSVEYSLKQTSRWAALFAYISIGLILFSLLCLTLAWSFFERLFLTAYGNTGVLGGVASGIVVIILVVVAVCIFMLALLLMFSNRVKKGLAEKNLPLLEDSVASLKLYFTISGILGGLFIVLAVLPALLKIFF